MNRQDISRLEINRSIHFKLGFVIAISMVTLAFNYTTEPPAPYEVSAEPEEDDNFITTVPITKDIKRKLTPPVVKVTEVFIPDDTEFMDKPDPVEPIVDVNPVDNPRPIPVIQPAVPSKPTPQILPEEPTEDIPEIFEVVEHMPLFGDCNHTEMDKEQKKQCSAMALFKYMGERIKYPAMARENGIEGTVVIRFIVDEAGNITAPEIVKDIGGGCGQEALRVVRKMPAWEPGRQRNRKVKVYFNLPVKFKLS